MAHQLLLADDSVTIQRVIKLTFADEDVEVVTVGDGNQAVASIDQQPPDIVLADVAMPGRTGYEVAQHIRTSPRLAHIPVLLLTGAFEPVDETKASEVGCDGILAKPFEPDVVVSRVKELLARPRSVAPAPVTAPVVVPAPVAPPSAPATPPPAFAPAFAAGPATTLAPSVVVKPKPASFTVNLPAAPAPAALSAVERAASAVEGLVLGNVENPVPGKVEGTILFPAPAPPAPLASTTAVAPPASKASDVDAYFERLDQAFASLALSPRTPPPPAPVTTPEPAAPPALSWPFDAPAAPAAPAVAVAPSTSSVSFTPAAVAAPAATAAVVEAMPLTPAQIDQIADRVVEKLTARLGVNLSDVVANVAERIVSAEIDQIKKRV